ncbi:MAG: Gfo/Idh/MocA family oxidoreductase [Verrucomicrobiales bacterium]|nr:Gfo/Idh/MocA family oxidoreductase [Verrucomicrobiales bacterium]
MNESEKTRRDFLQKTAVTAAAASAFPAGVHAQKNSKDELKVALIGCGGRGTGAAAQALAAGDKNKMWAMADIDPKQLERSKETLIKNSKDGAVDVPTERQFVGLEAYKQVMEMDEIDVVILTTPPGFRSFHFEAAVQAGKHAFLEKPVATDAPGVRRVLKSAAEAKAKNLKVGVGFNRRHSTLHKNLIGRLHDGVIGEIPLIQVYNCRGPVNKRQTRQPGWSELEFQIRNWYYFTWLSGDFIVEQSVHEFDVVRWIKHEQNPVSCIGQGGKIVMTGEMDGQTYDHFSADYRFADGSQVITTHRHIPKCWNFFGEKITGTKGTAELKAKSSGLINLTGQEAPVFREREASNSYQIEHDELFSAIRNDTEFNEGERGGYSTLFSMMGRMAAYTGKEITWEQALNDDTEIARNPVSFDEETPIQPGPDGIYDVVAKPGVG